MVTGAVAGNISAEATTPTGNIFAEAMRGETSRSRTILSASLRNRAMSRSVIQNCWSRAAAV